MNPVRIQSGRPGRLAAAASGDRSSKRHHAG